MELDVSTEEIQSKLRLLRRPLSHKRPPPLATGEQAANAAGGGQLASEPATPFQPQGLGAGGRAATGDGWAERVTSDGRSDGFSAGLTVAYAASHAVPPHERSVHVSSAPHMTSYHVAPPLAADTLPRAVSAQSSSAVGGSLNSMVEQQGAARTSSMPVGRGPNLRSMSKTPSPIRTAGALAVDSSPSRVRPAALQSGREAAYAYSPLHTPPTTGSPTSAEKLASLSQGQELAHVGNANGHGQLRAPPRGGVGTRRSPGIAATPPVGPSHRVSPGNVGGAIGSPMGSVGSPSGSPTHAGASMSQMSPADDASMESTHFYWGDHTAPALLQDGLRQQAPAALQMDEETSSLPSSRRPQRSGAHNSTAVQKQKPMDEGVESPSGAKAGAPRNAEGIQYLTYEDLTPFTTAPDDRVAIDVLDRLSSSSTDWASQFRAIDDARRLARFTPRLLVGGKHLRKLVTLVAALADSLRSALAKNGLRCIGELFAVFGPRLDAELEVCLQVGFRRAADTQSFISEEAEATLREVCKAATEAKVLTPLLAMVSHRRAEVRNKAVRCLAMLAQRLHARGTAGQKELRVIAETAAKALGDASPDVRQSARMVAVTLSRAIGDGTLEDCMATAKLQAAVPASGLDPASFDAFDPDAVHRCTELTRTTPMSAAGGPRNARGAGGTIRRDGGDASTPGKAKR